MTRELKRTAAWSAIPSARRTRFRTSSSGRRPRPHGCFLILEPSWWQLTTRPPRGRSGSQLPVEAGVLIWVRAGRNVAIWQRAQMRGW